MRPTKWLDRLGSLPAIWLVVVGICSVALLLIRTSGLRIASTLSELNGHKWVIPVSMSGRPLCSVHRMYGELPECGVLREYTGYADIIAVSSVVIAVAGMVFILIGVAARTRRRARTSGKMRIKRQVVGAPGHLLHRLAEFFYSRKTMEFVFDPMLADMRGEYFEALSKGRVRKARWIHLLYCWNFTRVVVLNGVVGLLSEVVRTWKLFW